MAQARDGSQLSFADVAAEGRRRKLEEKRGRHLAMIGELVPWEDFRPVLEAVWRKAEGERKSAAGRKPWDAVLMFKAIVLGALYNLSDEALDATKLADGRIVVVNRGTTELRVFDAAGTYLDTWGGKGEGPGEFSDVRDIESLAGDSVLAWALMHPTVTLFDANGIPARTFPSRRRLSDESWHFVLPVAVAADASILAVQNKDFCDTDSVAVELWDAEGGLRSPLGVHPGQPHHLIEGRARYPEIFGRQLALAPWGDLIVISPTDRYQINAFGKDGTLARIVRRSHVPRPPTRAHVEAFIERKIAATGERRLWEAVPVADHIPPIASVMADALHNLWVEEYEVPGEEVPGVLWTVFDPAGRMLGFVETPEGLEIYEIGKDYILGVTQDEFDVQYVQMWSLERSGE